MSRDSVLRSVKRTLRPLRPVLGPIWRRLRRVKPAAPKPAAPYVISAVPDIDVTGDVTREFLARVEHERSDGARAQRLLDLPGGRTARAS